MSRAPQRATNRGFVFLGFQLVIMGFAAWLVYDLHVGAGTWWASTPGSDSFWTIWRPVVHDPVVVIGVAFILVALAGLSLLTWTLFETRNDPDALRYWQERVEKRDLDVERLRQRVAEAELAQTNAEQARERLAQENRAQLGAIPMAIQEYYRAGLHLRSVDAALARRATRERVQWEALAHTFHTGPLAPLLASIEAIPRDHAGGVHHYSTEEVLDLLVGLSQGLREDDWFGRALRWVEAKYG